MAATPLVPPNLTASAIGLAALLRPAIHSPIDRVFARLELWLDRQRRRAVLRHLDDGRLRGIGRSRAVADRESRRHD